jgi:hypothetical protein
VATSDGSPLSLAFFGDGPKWDNFVLTLSLPSGVSNYRPFRYSDHRVAPDVLSAMATDAGRKSLLASPVWLAARFGAQGDESHPYRWHLLPLRQVELTHIDYSPGNHSVYFRAGPLFDFRKVSDIRDALFTIPTSEHAALTPGHIFFRTATALPLAPVDPQDEREAWTRLCDLLAATNSPVHDEAKRAVFVRFAAPRDSQGDPVVADRLFTSQIEGRRFGWTLRESDLYEMAWDHRLPVLVGTSHSLSARMEVTATLDSASVTLANSTQQITSNYEQHSLPLTARSPSGTFEALTLKPNPDQVPSSAGLNINAVDVRALLSVKKNVWYRMKRSLMTTGAVIIVAVVAILSERVKEEGWQALGATVLLILLRVLEERFKQ